MALTQTQFDNLVTLFNSEDFSYVQQGIELVDALIDNEQDFVAFLENMGSCTLTDFTFDELKSVFGFVTEKSTRHYLAIWALGILAQWNQKVLDTTTLNLGGNQLTTLPDSIGNLTNLNTLNLGGNKYLGGNQLTTLPKSIGNLNNLNELYLENNQLTTLPDSIENLTNLTHLYLNDNPISADELERIQALLPNCDIKF